MYEVLGILCGLAVAAALIGCVIVLPIVAFLRTDRIAELSKRVARLEQELGEFRRGVSGAFVIAQLAGCCCAARWSLTPR